MPDTKGDRRAGLAHEQRAARLEEALRANLRKRKKQAQARSGRAAESQPAADANGRDRGGE
jgi:hypothetical protein